MLNQYDETIVATAFDSVAEAYGEVAFLRRTAQALVDSVAARNIRNALDVATGPGTAALLLAKRFPNARITGVDVSADMLANARARAAFARMSGLDFVSGSATKLSFEAAHFDLAICSSAIYYMPDLAQAVTEWSRVLRPGGSLAFSTYGAGVLEPMSSLFDARIRSHGVVVPQPTPLYRLTQPHACAELLAGAGLTHVRIEERQLGFWLPNVESWWTMLMSTGFRLPVSSLDEAGRANFEREHKREIAPHIGERGLWVNVPAIIAVGEKRAGSAHS